jgi:hypothetical protein
MKPHQWVLLAIFIGAVVAIGDTYANAGEPTFRARYAEARSCRIEGDNPYHVLPQNQCYFPSAASCRVTLGKEILANECQSLSQISETKDDDI